MCVTRCSRMPKTTFEIPDNTLVLEPSPIDEGPLERPLEQNRPFAEQVEDEKQWRRFGPLGWRVRQKRIDLPQEHRDHPVPLFRRGFQRRFWQVLCVG